MMLMWRTTMKKEMINKHKLVKPLQNLQLTQLVKEVTRPVSGTCLGHIWTSHPERMACVQTTLECQIALTAGIKYLRVIYR